MIKVPRNQNLQTQANTNTALATEADQNLKQSLFIQGLDSEAGNLTTPTIFPGFCADRDGIGTIELTAAIGKRIDQTWVEGSGLGGRDPNAGLSAQGYHLWVIKNPTTGVVDGFISSSISPIFPAGYTLVRRVVTFVRTGAGIVQFTARNGTVAYSGQNIETTAANVGTSTTLRSVLGVPEDIPSIVFGNIGAESDTNSQTQGIAIGDAEFASTIQPQADTALGGGRFMRRAPAGSSHQSGDFSIAMHSNAGGFCVKGFNGLLALRANIGTPNAYIQVLGYIDLRR